MRLLNTTKNQLGTIYRYRHKTGLDWIHISNSSKNNVFTIGFKTTINDNTGLPHILEHLTLASSRNYKKNPFFNMLSRSYSNFMNALTGDDLTMYPFSTVNSQDYENLLRIYLDCCFYPTLSKLDFMQEGWRYQNGAFQGVVYNEMKGVVSDPGSYFMIEHQKQLYPGTNYGFNSGGDPLAIPTLDYNALRQFHQQKYHPSNAFIFTFGDMDMKRPMQIVQEYIDTFESISVDPIHPTRRWTEPKSIHLTGPLDGMLDPAQQDRFAMSFLTNEHKDLMESYTLKLISDLLLDGAASPMYKALIESKLGTDYAPTTGYSTYSFTTHQSIGVQGCTNSEKVQKVIYDTLETSYRNGFRPERIESVLRQFEMSIRHRVSMFGMHLGWNTLRFMIHDGDPLRFLDLDNNLKELRTTVQQPGYIQNKIKEYFLENNHVLKLLMTPDPEHGRKVSESESQLLKAFESKLTSSDVKEWNTVNEQLIEKQNEKTDLNDLPILSLDEISRQVTLFSTEEYPISAENSEQKLFHRKTNTNGINYLYLKVDLSHIPEQDKPLIPLLCRAITSLGTKNKSLEVLDEQIRLNSGGIHASCVVTPHPSDVSKRGEYIEIYTTCLQEQFQTTIGLVKEILEDVDWSKRSEFITCWKSMLSEMSQRVVGEGHSFAMSMASSSLTPYSQLNETWSGLAQLKFLETIDPEVALPQLAHIMDQIRLSTVDAFMVSEESPQMEIMGDLWSVFKSTKTNNKLSPFETVYQRKSHEMDLGINFVAQTFVGVPFSHPDAPKLKLLSSILTSQFLHTELREKSGAYGGAARYAPKSGLFHFMTYRDPLGYERTLNTFSKSIEWIKTNGITDEMMEEAKLDVLKQLDTPVDAGQEGLTHFVYGNTSKLDQQFRDGVFDATKNDILEVIHYLQQPSSVGLIGEPLGSF
jgi:Zn-dependent M16 (insulinase) family peptidase